MPVLDVDVQVLEDPHDARGVGRRAIAGDGHEIDLAEKRQLAHQIGHEEDGAFEHADQEKFAPLVLGRYLAAQLGDALAQLLLRDEDFTHTGVEMSIVHSHLSPCSRDFIAGGASSSLVAFTAVS